MWFGTPDGLCRYDGNVLTPYKFKSQHDEPANNFVRGQIKEDKKGNIWYSNETGIYKWDAFLEKVVLVFLFPGQVYKNSQFSMIEIYNNDLWLMNFSFGVTRFNIETQEIKIFPIPGYGENFNLQYSFVKVDNEGNIWFRMVTANEPFLKFDKKTFAFTPKFADDPPHAVFFNEDKRVLAYENKLVFQYYNQSAPVVIPKIINGKNISFHSSDGIMDSHNRTWMIAREAVCFITVKMMEPFMDTAMII